MRYLPDDHDGIIPRARFVEVLNIKLWTSTLRKQFTFPYMVTIWVLTVRTTQGNTTIPASEKLKFNLF